MLQNTVVNEKLHLIACLDSFKHVVILGLGLLHFVEMVVQSKTEVYIVLINVQRCF